MASGARPLEHLRGRLGDPPIEGRTRPLPPRRCNGGGKAIRVRRQMLLGKSPRDEQMHVCARKAEACRSERQAPIRCKDTYR